MDTRKFGNVRFFPAGLFTVVGCFFRGCGGHGGWSGLLSSISANFFQFFVKMFGDLDTELEPTQFGNGDLFLFRRLFWRPRPPPLSFRMMANLSATFTMPRGKVGSADEVKFFETFANGGHRLGERRGQPLFRTQ